MHNFNFLQVGSSLQAQHLEHKALQGLVKAPHSDHPYSVPFGADIFAALLVVAIFIRKFFP